VTYRAAPRSSDITAVRSLTQATRMFRPDEVEIALELVTDGVEKGERSEYRFLFVDGASGLDGYICYGPTACTVGTWDLYWIAVDPKLQGQGLGRRLVDAMETEIRRQSGRMITVDTSGRADYTPTRAFYERVGYAVAATIPDFYAPGDAKVVFIKRL
jgi:ribosomal protein S18 acetylase RimI-like enzyme